MSFISHKGVLDESFTVTKTVYADKQKTSKLVSSKAEMAGELPASGETVNVNLYEGKDLTILSGTVAVVSGKKSVTIEGTKGLSIVESKEGVLEVTPSFEIEDGNTLTLEITNAEADFDICLTPDFVAAVLAAMTYAPETQASEGE